MDKPASPFGQIAAQREDIQRRRAALDEEELALINSVTPGDRRIVQLTERRFPDCTMRVTVSIPCDGPVS